MDWFGRSVVFREPEGARKGMTFVALGILCFGIYGYFLTLHSHHSVFFLFLGSMNLLAALPDFLPRERTTLAGALRILGVLYAIVVVTYVIFLY